MLNPDRACAATWPMTGVICSICKRLTGSKGARRGHKEEAAQRRFKARVAMTALSGTIFLHFSAAY
jgi:hypothetical protein